MWERRRTIGFLEKKEAKKAAQSASIKGKE
jgi:hypothetical protein